MKNKYIDLIEQTFDFPQDEFTVTDNELNFYGIPLMEIIKQYGTPLKITYLPKISQQINRAKRLFNVAMAKTDYKGFIQLLLLHQVEPLLIRTGEALKNDIHLETVVGHTTFTSSTRCMTAESSTRTVISSATDSSVRSMWRTSPSL